MELVRLNVLPHLEVVEAVQFQAGEGVAEVFADDKSRIFLNRLLDVGRSSFLFYLGSQASESLKELVSRLEIEPVTKC